MIALLAVESRRYVARRILRVFLLAAVGISTLSGVLVFLNHQSQDDSALADSEAGRRVAIARCLSGESPFPGEYVEVYSEDFGWQGPAPEVADREFFCERFVNATQRVDLRYHLTSLGDLIFGLLVPFSLIAMVFGASFIGAEWRANTVAVQLTWESRRVRLMLAKATIAVLFGAGVFLALQVIFAAGMLPTIAFRGTTAGADAAWLRETLGVLGRGAFFAGILSCIGFSAASIGRNTSAALGVLAGYFAVFEGALVGSLLPGIRPWLLVGNTIVFVSGETTPDIEGRSVIEAGAILALYAGIMLFAATMTFRQRDVAG